MVKPINLYAGSNFGIKSTLDTAPILYVKIITAVATITCKIGYINNHMQACILSHT